MGWCETLKAIADLKLTSEEVLSTKGKTYQQYFAEYLKIPSNEPLDRALSRLLDVDPGCTAVANLEWIGLGSKDQIPWDVAPTPLDVLCSLCLSKLKYSEGERDALILKHRFEVEFPDDGWRETRESVMLDFGLQPNGNSSMARTVSLPLAVAIRALTEGRISKRGVVRPVDAELYAPILKEVEDLGIHFEESTLSPLLWVRDEVKPGEHRVAITPKNAQKLLAAGWRVWVERSRTRCIADAEFAKVGCKLVESGSWRTDAPYSALIIGLKELPQDVAALKHRHIFFAHAFKGQNEAAPLLKRFKAVECLC